MGSRVTNVFPAAKNVVKHWATKFKLVPLGEFDRNFATPNRPHLYSHRFETPSLKTSGTAFAWELVHSKRPAYCCRTFGSPYGAFGSPCRPFVPLAEALVNCLIAGHGPSRLTFHKSLRLMKDPGHAKPVILKPVGPLCIFGEVDLP